MTQPISEKSINSASQSVRDEPVMAKPGTREPWFWIIISPLILVLFACAITISIAVINADDVVVGNYYKQGLAVNEEFSLADNARSLGLSGEMRFDQQNSTIQIDFLNTKSESLPVLPEELILHLSHPAEKREDRNVILTLKSPGIYSGTVLSKIDNRWYWQLNPSSSAGRYSENQRWQLTGELIISDRDEILVSF